MRLALPLVKLAITTGEPAGVGPEISLAAACEFLGEQSDVEITLLSDAGLLESAQLKKIHLLPDFYGIWPKRLPV